MSWVAWVLFVVQMLIKYGPQVLKVAIEVWTDVKDRKPAAGTRVSSRRDMFTDVLVARLKDEGRELSQDQIEELRRYAKGKVDGRSTV